MEFLVILGPPGSGKGTLSRLLQSRHGFRPVSTGEEIRREMADPASEVGRASRPYMERGDYIPDDLALSLFFSILNSLSADARLALDGFPRTVPQAERFDARVAEGGHRLLGCVFLDLPAAAAAERLRLRRVCVDCRRPYHLENHPPARPEICDDCGGRLIPREDDDPERMAQRLRRHREQTRPLRDWFRDRHGLLELDGALDPEELETMLAGHFNLQRT